jgi:hypothetical protein
MDLYINTAARSPRHALIKSTTVTAPAPKPVFVIGDDVTLNVYLCNGAGALDARSGDDDNYRLRVAIGTPGAIPTGGTFSIGFLGTYSPAIVYNATAAQVQTALGYTATIGSGNSSVTGAWPTYQIEFTGALGNGDRALLSGRSTNLTPSGQISVTTLQAGGGTFNEIQLVRVMAAPDVLTYAFTGATAGSTPFIGSFEVFGRSLAAALGGEAEAEAVLEIELETLVTGARTTLAQINATVRNEIIIES